MLPFLLPVAKQDSPEQPVRSQDRHSSLAELHRLRQSATALIRVCLTGSSLWPVLTGHGGVCRDGKGAGVMVGGRTVEVDVALSQDDARSLASGKGAASGGKDNRNLYLVCYLPSHCLHD